MSSVPEPTPGASSADSFFGSFDSFLSAFGGSAAKGLASRPPAGPSSADSVFASNLGFDNSGWNANFGAGAINAPSSKTTSQGGATPLAAGSADYVRYGLMLIGMLMAWKLLRAKR